MRNIGGKVLGWRRALPDFRNVQYKLNNNNRIVPEVVDLRAVMPPIYDQGNLGSCTLNATVAAIACDIVRQQQGAFMGSRLFGYYNARAREDCIDSDSGCTIPDAIKAIRQLGICAELTWPYDESQVTVRPSTGAYTEALQVKIDKTESLSQSLNMMQGCLMDGYPIVCGISIFSSFPMDTKDGIVSMPTVNDSLAGGHAILLVGYDNKTDRFIFRNSWGTGWGDSGYGYLPYDYILNSGLAADFWKIVTVLEIDPIPVGNVVPTTIVCPNCKASLLLTVMSQL